MGSSGWPGDEEGSGSPYAGFKGTVGECSAHKWHKNHDEAIDLEIPCHCGNHGFDAGTKHCKCGQEWCTLSGYKKSEVKLWCHYKARKGRQEFSTKAPNGANHRPSEWGQIVL